MSDVDITSFYSWNCPPYLNGLSIKIHRILVNLPIDMTLIELASDKYSQLMRSLNGEQRSLQDILDIA